MINLQDIKLSYGSKKVLKSVSIDIEEGIVITLVGENGAGKTSLINAVSDLVPFQGEIRIDGEVIKRKDYLYKRNLGFFLKENGFFSTDIPVSDHFHLVYDLYGQPDDFFGKLSSYGDALNISPNDDTLIRDLSDGMRHKILFMCAISHSPKYLLLDEPFNYMDENSISKSIAILKDLIQDQCGILLVTHNSKYIEQISDTVVLLDDGVCSPKEDVAEILQEGSLESNEDSFLIYLKNKYSKPRHV
jgi:ABC-2 type transport system ATP-binding protein